MPKRFAVLSGIGLQMGLIIFAGAYAGKYLDQYFALERKLFTIALTLFAVAIALYFVLKQINKLNDKEQ